MNEGIQIKEELFSLYKGIKKDIPSDKLPTARKKMIENVSTLDSITLITYIKESIPLLINHKISEAISSNSNNNDYSIELELNNKKQINIRSEYLQLENQIRKLENDNKYYLKNFLQYKIQKDVLEMKLNAYMSLEDEYEELKEKVKYEGGKFLDNDRKDNEIIILRSENSALKKEIIKLESINKISENKIKDYQKNIKTLQNNIESLNRKIFDLEKIINKSTKNSLYRDKSKTNSCFDFGIKKNDNTFDKFENMQKVPTGKNYNNYINIKNMKAIYPQTLNLKNKRVINLHSPKNDFFHLDNNKIVNNKANNTINTNFMASTFNKINKFNNKKIKIPIKNEFNTLKNIRNNSITIIKVEKDDSKSLSINKNKITGERNKNDNNLNKTGNKVKTFNKLLSSNPQYISPISYKGSRNNGKMLNKYIKRDINKNIMNNFTQKHRANSNKH
jgi:hypothetical protein